MEENDIIKYKLTFEGYPISFLSMLIITIGLCLALPDVRFLILAVGLIVSLVYLKSTLTNYPLQLPFEPGCEFGLGDNWGVAVYGIPPSFCDDIQELIHNRQTIVVGCPDHPRFTRLRVAISDYVRSKKGHVQFEDSQTFYLYTAKR